MDSLRIRKESAGGGVSSSSDRTSKRRGKTVKLFVVNMVIWSR